MAERRTALVTGGSGFIGSHLVSSLLQDNWQVRCLVRESSSLDFLPQDKVELVTGKLEDQRSLLKALEGVGWVFHLAGRIKGSSRAEFFHTNWEGTKNLLEAAAAMPRPPKAFLYLSSLSAAGPGRPGQPLREEDEAHPVSYYGQSKLAAEREVARSADLFPAIIIRPAAVYGPREREIFQVIRLAGQGIRFRLGWEDTLISLIHVADLVRAIILAGRQPEPGVKTYFISDGQAYSWRRALKLISRLLEAKSIPLTIPWNVAYCLTRGAARFCPRSRPASYLDKIREMRHKYWVCSLNKAQRELGFSPEFDFEDGIRETIQWYRAQGWL